MNQALLTAFALAAFATFTPPSTAAESEAMQRERALNRILVAERHEREREAAARGNGLIAMDTLPRPSKQPKKQGDKIGKGHPTETAPAWQPAPRSVKPSKP